MFDDVAVQQVSDNDQTYFWTEVWQAGEREADEDLAQGRVERFETLDALFADLDADN